MKNDKELFEALLAGKTLVSVDGDEARFVENGFLNTNWNFSYHKDWEIKPEPMEFWISIFDSGSTVISPTYDEAPAGAKTIKVREVIE